MKIKLNKQPEIADILDLLFGLENGKLFWLA
jgi:hypothetical protein